MSSLLFLYYLFKTFLYIEYPNQIAQITAQNAIRNSNTAIHPQLSAIIPRP